MNTNQQENIFKVFELQSALNHIVNDRISTLNKEI